MASTAMEHEPHGAHQTKKATASGWIGSALEYYDFFIYATAASLIFPQLFFPKGDPTVAIVASLATYGVGYVARPIGAFFLGHWGDTHGRKTVLLICMFLMGISTMGVGLLPTYAQVGWWAPFMLVVLRLIQGFAVAGEISGASSMILEHAPFGRRGFFASFTLQGVQAGQILAAAVFLPLARFMPRAEFVAWVGRSPQAAGARMKEWLTDKALSGIRDRRCAGVRHERDALSAFESRDERPGLARFVVFVEAGRWRGDGVPRQQVRGPPRILCGDHRRLAQDAQRPPRNVFEVADGRGDHEQGAGHRTRGLLYH